MEPMRGNTNNVIRHATLPGTVVDIPSVLEADYSRMQSCSMFKLNVLQQIRVNAEVAFLEARLNQVSARSIGFSL